MSICSAFLYLVVLRVFAVHFCIWLCCEYLQSISVFGCATSIGSAFLYLVAFRVFAEHFCIWLCCEYLQHVSAFLLVAFQVYAERFCIWLHSTYLQSVSVFGSVVPIWQGKFTYIAHFIHNGNSKCFT